MRSVGVSFPCHVGIFGADLFGARRHLGCALVAGRHKHGGGCWAAAPHSSPWSCGRARGKVGSAEVCLAIGYVRTRRGAPGRGGILRGVDDTGCTPDRCDGGPQQRARIACACCAFPCCAYSVLCVPLLCIPVLRAFLLGVWCTCACPCCAFPCCAPSCWACGALVQLSPRLCDIRSSTSSTSRSARLHRAALVDVTDTTPLVDPGDLTGLSGDRTNAFPHPQSHRIALACPHAACYCSCLSCRNVVCHYHTFCLFYCILCSVPCLRLCLRKVAQVSLSAAEHPGHLIYHTFPPQFAPFVPALLSSCLAFFFAEKKRKRGGRVTVNSPSGTKS